MAKTADGGRVNAHHNPMTTFKPHRRAPLRQRRPRRTPRNTPDRLFDRVFAALRSNRDRAMLAFFISTGARASELVGVTNERLSASSVRSTSPMTRTEVITVRSWSTFSTKWPSSIRELSSSTELSSDSCN
ncbi:hypothetical protein [Streptomyces pinistramenti]|uniref:hypothetical protein n=1 Tax=Streptomyces pinistramenti TaxID=2884812 RepID=UPI001D05F891|nr:hypothetical protein [Streptomyces pinistramenti]MCB5906925.1 hypothetical protein [Streptomyces pinistramenti]